MNSDTHPKRTSTGDTLVLRKTHPSIWRITIRKITGGRINTSRLSGRNVLRAMMMTNARTNKGKYKKTPWRIWSGLTRSNIETLKALKSYVDSGLWQKDFEAAERGEIGTDCDLFRVLSEDGLYNFLQDAKEILQEVSLLNQYD